MFSFWMKPEVGGKESLDSYGGSLDNVPDSHWKFLAEAPLYFEGDDFICVHGGLDSTLPMSEQKNETLLNKRFHLAEPHYSGKLVICGHTRQVDGIPKLSNNTLNIDTNVFDGGYLTAYDTVTKMLYQVNNKGDRKSFSADDLAK
jgi:serine/threonine protein phosphatase 1